MASGGYQPTKQGRPEPQRQTNWQRSFSSDRDDAHSLNSLPGDMRINNWDLSDLHPSNLEMNSKRRKKSKGNPEREREQSLSMESPPNEKKHHTPSSFPRTKITANTPKSQRVALENIRLHMTFSDVEDDQANIDGERNNERQVRHRQRSLPNGSLNRASSDDSIRATSLALLNRNNNMHRSSKEQGPDRNEIVARLAQIRDFMKQARSMMDSLERLGNKKRTEDVEKVWRLIRNLQEQEQGYKGILQNSMKQAHDDADDNDDDDDGDDETAEDDGDDNVLAMEDVECSDENTSVDLDVDAEITETSQDSRPQIESKLGIDSDGDGKDADPLEMFTGAGRESVEDVNHSGLAESDQATVVHSGVSVPKSQEDTQAALSLGGEVLSDARQDLLQILRQKEQQLQALMSRQEELNILRERATKKLMEAKAKDNIVNTSLTALIESQKSLGSRPQPMQALEMLLRGAGTGINGDDERVSEAARQDRQLKSNIVGYPESDDEDNSKVLGVEALPNKLMELKRQLTYLKNEFSQISEDPNNMETDARAMAEGQQQLQKLRELQNKKHQLDMRLQELQLIHCPAESSRNNEANSQTSITHPVVHAGPQVPAILQHHQQTTEKTAPTSDPAATAQSSNLQIEANALASFDDWSAWSQFAQDPGPQPGMLKGLQEKLRYLKEVREQRNYLKSAVQLNQVEQEAVVNGDDRQPALGNGDGGDPRPHTPTNTAALSSGSSFQQSHSLTHHLQQRLKQRSQPHVKQQPLTQQKQKQPQQKQHQPQQKLQPTVTQYPPQQGRDRPDGIGAAASSRNMTQLLNLEGTDPGDEHSDEDNVSASKSGSAWSVLDSWDIDPEVQEKVRKLKYAKENLRQLQDLVAIVQQSSDAGDAADRTASVDGEIVSQATQTDELNVSVSEGELPSESLRILQRDDDVEELDDEIGEMDDPVAELEELQRERSMLLEIQNQLQRIQSQTSGPRTEDVRDRSRRNSSSTPVVTFASNDELYGKIRRQRIIHEELRSKKRELEAIMKKDRNRKQYSRNQDNQSDSISLTTDTFGAAASIDATMATWGGSTADNLENITEDEDGQERDTSDRREEDNEDEDVDSPPRNRRSRRNVQRRSNLGPREENPRRSLKRQEDDDDDTFTVPNVDWYRGIESRLSDLSSAVEALLKRSETEGRKQHVSSSHESAPHSSSTGPSKQDQQQQLLQLQNQLLMLSFGQLVQSLARQQGDIQHLQQQVQSLQLQIQAASFEHMPPAVAVNLPSPFRQPQLSPVVSTSSSRRGAADRGVHPVVINHQQKSNLHSQRNVDNPNLFGNHFTGNSGFSSLQSGSVSISARHLPQGAGKTPADGACSNLDARQPMPLTQQGPATGKSGMQVKKAFSDSTSGVGTSAARSEKLGQNRSRAYSSKKEYGLEGSRAPPSGKPWARLEDFDQDGSSCCSSQSASSRCSGMQRVQVSARSADSGAAVTNSSALFDTLRDTIYTEVASLISQNENRPYFLLELFRDMRRVDSDGMRQQALNSLQTLLHSGHRIAVSPSAPAWSQSTQTHDQTARTGHIPSKSLLSEDDDDLSERQLQEEINTERSRFESEIRNSILQNGPFGSAEPRDNLNMSVPTNGDEVSHTWQKYLPSQEKPRHGTTAQDSRESTEKRSLKSDPKMHQRMDTRIWDQQVRDILATTSTTVGQHMDDVCSAQLLNYIRVQVMFSVSVLADQEFVHQCQHQLPALLEESLQKYRGQRMRECGEDLLKDLSNILHNELAYFGLVHDLDDRVVPGQGKSRDRPVQITNSENTPEHSAVSRTSAGAQDKVDGMNKYANSKESLEDRSQSVRSRTVHSEQVASPCGQKVTASNKNELENDDDDAGVSEQSYTDELTEGEMKPFTRIGSDEMWSMNDPSETAVSRDARLRNNVPHPPLAPPPPTRPEAEGAREDGVERQNRGQSRLSKSKISSRGEEEDAPSSVTYAAASLSQVNPSATEQTHGGTHEEQTQAASCERLTQSAGQSDPAARSDSVSAPSSCLMCNLLVLGTCAAALIFLGTIVASHSQQAPD